MLNRRVFLAGSVAILGAPLAAEAQRAGKVARICIVGDKAADASENHLWEVFRDGLREYGWSDGANLVIEYRWAEGNAARLPELAAQLVRLKLDVIVTRGSLFTGALKAATSTIPIVFVGHADPVETGHVASLARPGGNITGMAVLQTELSCPPPDRLPCAGRRHGLPRAGGRLLRPPAPTARDAPGHSRAGNSRLPRRPPTRMNAPTLLTGFSEQ